MEINEEAGKNCYKNIKNGIIIRRNQCNDKNISSHSEIFMVYRKRIEMVWETHRFNVIQGIKKFIWVAVNIESMNN